MKITNNFTFFWGTEDVFSNWHPATFVDYRDNTTYNCSEQFMMRHKAMLFGDLSIAEQVMNEASPREHKKLGRLIKKFDVKIWNLNAKRIVGEACYLKFKQNEKMLEELLIKTKGTILVEASPYDVVWGIGMKEDDAGIEDPKNWRGSNWLGKVLTNTRSIFEIESAAQLKQQNS